MPTPDERPGDVPWGIKLATAMILVMIFLIVTIALTGILLIVAEWAFG